MSRQTSQKIAFALLTAMAVIVVVPIVLVVVYIVIQGFGAISWEFLTGFPSNGMKSGGILPAVVGTVVLTFGTALASIPISVGAAIYLAEYARDSWLTRAIRMAIVNLAG
ncbi:MAG: phosphate ABC transporter, permease protein PstA, partial [Anaerolineae bacterium]